MATNINKQRILSRKVFGTGSNASLTDCPNSCSVNFSNVFGGTQTQWLSGAQGTAMTFGAGGIGDFSIAFWIYPTNLTTGDNMRIFDFGSGALTPPNGRLQIHINTSGTAMTTTLKVNNTATDPSGGTNLPFPQDTWTHVTWTASRTATDVSGKWYANGVFVGNTDTDPFPQLAVGSIPGNVVTTATTGPFYIGRSGAAGMFEGNLDDVTIWDRALTAAEIVEIMGVSIDPTVCMNSLSFYDDLTHWWAMGDPNSSVSYPIIPDVIGVQDMEMKGMSASNIDCSSSPGDEWTYIPDAAFQAKLIASHSVTFPIPNYCLTSDVSGITAFTSTFASIYNLTGIEDFAALTTLTVNGNKMITLDVSQNTALTYLDCEGQWPKMISLNVSGATALTELRCDNNKLTNLDVSSNTALLRLHCSGNQLNSLDVSQNTALWYLHIADNDFTSINITANTALTWFYCHENQLTSIDVSTNTALISFNCNSNLLTSIDVSLNTALNYLSCGGNNVSTLDASTNTALLLLSCKDSPILVNLDVRNGNNTAITYFNTTGNPNLSCINVDDVLWSDANWTDIDAWTSFNTNCALYTYIPDANFQNILINAYSVTFPITNYCLTSTINTITDLDITNQSIADLTGIEAFVALTALSCDSNNLTSLDVSANTALTALQCTNNSLTSLDLSANTALINLYCHTNPLTSLNITANTALFYLESGNSSLTSLDISNNTALEYLYIGNSQLTSLNVSTNVALKVFYCHTNQLTSLDVSNNTALTHLRCYSNLLVTLNVSTNTALTNLRCDDNKLTSLNIKNGNNSAIPNISFNATSNLFSCISVSDVTWATNNWTSVDAGVTFTTSFPC